MNRSTLAKALRRRLKRVAGVDPGAVQRLTDDEIIADYSVCSRCRAALFADSAAAARNAGTALEFIDLCEMAIAVHGQKCPAFQKN